MDGTRIDLDDTGNPVVEAGSDERYLILGSGDGEDGRADQAGDLASCDFVSGLWQPSTGGLAYPFDPADGIQRDPDTGDFVDPEPAHRRSGRAGPLWSSRTVTIVDAVHDHRDAAPDQPGPVRLPLQRRRRR